MLYFATETKVSNRPGAVIRRVEEDAVVVKKSAMHNTRTPDRGFNDPLVKILLGIGIVLTLMIYIAALLTSLEMLKLSMWLLGAYAVVGAICGLVRSIQYGKANRTRSA